MTLLVSVSKEITSAISFIAMNIWSFFCEIKSSLIKTWVIVVDVNSQWSCLLSMGCDNKKNQRRETCKQMVKMYLFQDETVSDTSIIES